MSTSWGSSGPRSVLLAGLGNPDRGDDGFGPAVLARLARLSLPEAERIVCARPLDLLDRWPGRRLAIVVDAAMGEEPGRLRRLEPLCQGLPRPTACSTHGLGLAEAIDLGRSLGLLPARLIVYAAEGLDFSPGAPLSPRVAAAVEEAAARIAAECRG
ncbi:hydrogenase maturation protease [Methylacidimicrobium tartarophylax]|uniref:Hydrogenase maturation protease n=1 Tax=Methylacidimicrobium tartarophylax TaxID=1041768 RepID=A0A5E6MDQ7_9BACT|nr:hydrogenase maturation protease [Methylacidimicrobium tartarophylax]VVM06466.1 hydrogenase maturation protease [Methylacidimicrobium tartarophylax]